MQTVPHRSKQPRTDAHRGAQGKHFPHIARRDNGGFIGLHRSPYRAASITTQRHTWPETRLQCKTEVRAESRKRPKPAPSLILRTRFHKRLQIPCSPLSPFLRARCLRRFLRPVWVVRSLNREKIRPPRAKHVQKPLALFASSHAVPKEVLWVSGG